MFFSILLKSVGSHLNVKSLIGHMQIDKLDELRILLAANAFDVLAVSLRPSLYFAFPSNLIRRI